MNSNSVAAFDDTGKQVGVVFETATPFDTPRLMGELVEWYRAQAAGGGLHPLLAIAVFVVVFLEIHPFQDGNGRLSRVLTNLLLLQSGYSYAPYSSLESVVEQNKQGYYLALRQTQGTIRRGSPNWEPWLLFFLRSLRAQVTRLEEKVGRERLLLANLPELSVKLLELARERGRLPVQEIQHHLGHLRASTTLRYVQSHQDMTRTGVAAMAALVSSHLPHAHPSHANLADAFRPTTPSAARSSTGR